MQTPSGSQTLIGDNPQIQVRNNSSGVVKIFELTATEHYLGRETGRAEPIGLQVPVDWVVLSRLQAVLRKIDDEWYIYDGDGVNPSSNRLFINNRVITPTEGHELASGDAIEIGQDVQNSVQIIYIDPRRLGMPDALKQKSVRITSDRPIILGRAEDADLVLSAPTVSRKHAAISSDGKGKYTLRNLSSNPIFVDRQAIEDTATISSGSIVQIGPYTFVLQKDELILADSGENIRLDVAGVTKVVKLKHNRSLCLLNDVSLAIEPGQLVAFVGGSGAGKSTLMRSLLGIERTSAGVVFLNGDNLTDNFNIYRNTIGYVPQMDIVHTNLTVREVLTYAAKLRLPADAEIDRVVDDTLRQIELTERQQTIVKSLSGGQLKRVSIGVELLADPKLFFLDEPTSGLDPGLDKKMMQLLRRLADRGCTVILVTHATSNITLCDRVAFMGLGGNLCYFGPPQQAIDFFNIPTGDFADIYINLETSDRVLDTACRLIRKHPHHPRRFLNLKNPRSGSS
jgi:ABC transport system ATP-binding/permease protein